MGDGIYPVDVISMCSANGDILPLRLRMEDESHQLMRVDIEEIVSSKKIQYVGIEAHIFFMNRGFSVKFFRILKNITFTILILGIVIGIYVTFIERKLLVVKKFNMWESKRMYFYAEQRYGENNGCLN